VAILQALPENLPPYPGSAIRLPSPGLAPGPAPSNRLTTYAASEPPQPFAGLAQSWAAPLPIFSPQQSPGFIISARNDVPPDPGSTYYTRAITDIPRPALPFFASSDPLPPFSGLWQSWHAFTDVPRTAALISASSDPSPPYPGLSALIAAPLPNLAQQQLPVRFLVTSQEFPQPFPGQTTILAAPLPVFSPQQIGNRVLVSQADLTIDPGSWFLTHTFVQQPSPQQVLVSRYEQPLPEPGLAWKSMSPSVIPTPGHITIASSEPLPAFAGSWSLSRPPFDNVGLTAGIRIANSEPLFAFPGSTWTAISPRFDSLPLATLKFIQAIQEPPQPYPGFVSLARSPNLDPSPVRQLYIDSEPPLPFPGFVFLTHGWALTIIPAPPPPPIFPIPNPECCC
jgi:hypothetical protein